MGINYGRAVNCGRNISSIGYEIERSSNNAKTLTDMIPSGYDGQDARIFFYAVEQLQKEMNSIAYELKSLGDRVISVANQIKREEEEEERKILEAKMKAIKAMGR